MDIQLTMEQYLVELEGEKSEHTIKSYRSSLNQFVEWLNGSWEDINNMEDITPSIIRDYKQYVESRYKPATSNNRLIILKGLLEQHTGGFKANPIPAIQLKAVATQNATKWLERDDIPKLFHAIDIMARTSDNRKTMYRAIIGILVNCGLRVSEIVALKVKHVDTKGGLLFVNGKGNKSRTVPYGDKTRELLNEWLDVHNGGEYLFYSQRTLQMTTRAIQHIVKRLSKDTGIDFTVHQLRHTFAKKVADSTGRIEAVSSLLGHANIQTTRRYIEPSIKELQSYVNQVES